MDILNIMNIKIDSKLLRRRKLKNLFIQKRFLWVLEFIHHSFWGTLWIILTWLKIRMNSFWKNMLLLISKLKIPIKAFKLWVNFLTIIISWVLKPTENSGLVHTGLDSINGIIYKHNLKVNLLKWELWQIIGLKPWNNLKN